jgi:hypothetical protein
MVIGKPLPFVRAFVEAVERPLPPTVLANACRPSKGPGLRFV